jgi:hypothetical protein
VFDQPDLIRKDPWMIALTPTNLKVNDFFIRESLAKAERHHTLTRSDTVAETKPVVRLAIRLPRVTVIRRLGQFLPRPAGLSSTRA